MNYTDKDIVRLALADHAFREAKALAENVASAAYDPYGHLFSASVTGIVVSYCRPFMSSNGLGSLTSNYRDFPNTELKSIHDLIFEARNKVAAHMDILHVAGLHTDGSIPNHPGEVTVHLTMQGAFFKTTATCIHPSRIQDVIRLCGFQSKRVGSILGDIGADLLMKHGKFCTLTFRI